LRANLGPAAEAAVALVERAAGSRDSAVALQRRALASGVVDSGVVSLELARDLHATGLAADGRAVLIQGATTTSAIGQQAYRRMLEWVAEPEELNDWDATPTAQRSDWMRRFWGTRDVRAGWPEGTRLVEHFRRVEYAWQYFTLFLPRLGRHQVATRSQGIDTWVDYLLTKRMLGPEGLTAELAPEAGDEISLTSPENPAQRIRLTLEQLKAVGLNGPFFAFRTGQEELDDRGVVWIRYGKPTRAVRAAGGEALEVWAYDELEPRLVLQFRETNFDGQVGASTLVPTLIDVPGRFRDQFCGIEASLCTTETRSVEEIVNGYNDNTALGAKNLNAFQAVLTDRGRVNTPVIDRVVRDGKANIVRATTEDAHPHTFARSLDALVQLYGLRNLGTGEPVVLAAFALPGDELDGAPRAEAGNRIVYPVRFTLAALDARGGRIDLDTTRQFATAERLREGQFLSGALAMPVPAGRHAVSLVAEQPGGAGAMAALPALDVPGALATAWISSLVLGIEGSGLRWHSGRRAVALHPLNAYATNQPVTFYYQLGGLRAGATYRTTVELLRAGDDAAPPALTVAFEDEASEAVTEVERTLGLENLDPGRYHLRVRVEGASYGVTAQTSLRVVEAR
ncbi:MAG: hypothetical protein KC485_12580, partial [Gemmatimonadetes bacterium]|nr:hypothetical protein [Gemmatimonadota bacterium]